MAVCVLEAMSFDALAPHYRWMEFILAGEKLQRCRTTFLDEIPSPKKILLLGEGHGRGLVECCRRFANARMTCVDASKQMLIQSSRQLARHHVVTHHVEFIHADILDWKPRDFDYDLVISNFFLDCFRAEQLEQMISRLAQATVPHASWLIADFQTAAAGLWRIRSYLILWIMYVFFRMFTRVPAQKLTVPDPYLESAGFTLHRRQETEWGLLKSDWWKR